MYEVTLSVPASQEYLLGNFKQKTEHFLGEMDALSSELSKGDRFYFSVACSDTFRFQLRRLVVQNVCDIVALGYKNIFLRKCLHLQSGNFFQNLLVNTTCVFDRVTDKKAIAEIIDVDKPLFLDGYCNFRFGLLKKKWKEIASLVCSNEYILHDEQLIMEFLQYLLESIESGVEKLSVSLADNAFVMYGEDGAVLSAVESLAKHSTVEEDAALNVLLLNPREVVVYHGSKPSPEFCRLMQLFSCKFVCAQ